MKFVVKDGWVVNKFVDGAKYNGEIVESEKVLGLLFDSRGFPNYKCNDGIIEDVIEADIHSSDFYKEWVIANRKKGYAVSDGLWFEYLYMKEVGDPKAEEKKQEAILAVQKAKQDFPKV